VRVPASARWGPQTQRAVENFPISGATVDRSVIHALAAIKGAAAVENAALGLIEKEVAEVLAAAADEVCHGLWDDQFPVDVFQTGSGTSSNMNVNEVLASLASERLGREIRPNGQPNTSQSSNDVFPSAMHLAAADAVVHRLAPALSHLSAALRRKRDEFATVVKSGRTHLMDATPVTLGQEFGGYARAVDNGIERLEACLPRVAELPLGGTAVGTGLNAPDGFARRVICRLAEQTGLPLTEARDHFEAQGSRDALVELSGALRTVALSLYKMANDVRLMNSGPRTGLAEIAVPELQPGSSMMPGKVNPVMAEAMCQVVAQVIGNDAAVAFAGSSGTFELNVMLPVMARNVLEAVHLLTAVSVLFADRCVDGIAADVERCRRYAESSPSIGTSLNPVIGYERAAEVIKESTRTGRSIRELVLERGWMTDEELDRALDVLALTRGGIVS
jgi:fumarate hydratase, class II